MTTDNLTAELARLNDLDAKRTHLHPGFIYSRGDEKYWKEASPEVIALANKLHAENELLRAEVDEQCRINGLGGERELALMAKIERYEKLLVQAREAILCYDPDMDRAFLTAICAAGIGGHP